MRLIVQMRRRFVSIISSNAVSELPYGRPSTQNLPNTASAPTCPHEIPISVSLLSTEGGACMLHSVTEDIKHMSKPSDLVQGTLDMLLLKILALEPMNGFAVSQRLKQVSGDVLQMSDGSPYPARGRRPSRRVGLLARLEARVCNIEFLDRR